MLHRRNASTASFFCVLSMTAGLLTPTTSIHAKQLSGLSRLALSCDAVGCLMLVLVVILLAMPAVYVTVRVQHAIFGVG